MIDLTVTRNINADIDEVWAVLAHFGDLSWVPGSHRVEAIGSGVGMTRRIHMPGMPPIDEKLLSLDNAAHTLSYEIPPHEVIPFTDYLADIRVSEGWRHHPRGVALLLQRVRHAAGPRPRSD
jgi:hypothetical protein